MTRLRALVAVVVVVVAVVLATTTTVLATTDVVTPVSMAHKVEQHHSLHAPIDKSLVYWNYGGSTVATKNFVRLTPSTQDRRGWMWNEYPLEKESWEVEFKTEVFSKPHFGGDGMGFWVLAQDQDPSLGADVDGLAGPILGMKSTFSGFGVLFDVYDNDNRRNNPSIFVLTNFDGKAIKPNHDNDYEDDMYTIKPSSVPGHPLDDPKKTYQAHKCVADLRNTGKATKVLVKFLHKTLHVYVDTQEQSGYKFCLAVDLQRTFVDYHLAFTAATGQVADNMDVLEVTTRYLDETDRDTDDSLLAHLGASSTTHRFSGPYWFLVSLAGAALVGMAGYELWLFRRPSTVYQEAVRLCKSFDTKFLKPHWGLQAGVVFLLTFGGTWFTFLANAALLGYRAYLYKIKQHTTQPDDATNPMGPTVLPAPVRRFVTFAIYVASEMIYISHLLG